MIISSGPAVAARRFEQDEGGPTLRCGPCAVTSSLGDERMAVLDGLVPDFPIRTIAIKTQIAERLAACGLGPVFLR